MSLVPRSDRDGCQPGSDAILPQSGLDGFGRIDGCHSPTPPPAGPASQDAPPPRGAPAAPLSDLAARRHWQRDFFSRMGDLQQFRALFDHLPDVHFFAKDREGRCVAASNGVLLRLGYSHEDEALGLTDFDFHPPRIARQIREDDLRVMTTRQPLVGRTENLFTRAQAQAWYRTTKLPIFDRLGAVSGVMGIVRLYREESDTAPGAERLARVVEYIHAHHSDPIACEDLASLVHMSLRQLQRRFREVYGMGVHTFVMRTRVQAASDDLLLTNKSMCEIALDHGFCDQSAFSRHFAAHTGETPLRYRQRRRLNGGA
jgi:PAS domain S-box-containing protein